MDSTPVLIVKRMGFRYTGDLTPSDCLVVELSEFELSRLFRLMGFDALRRSSRRRIRRMDLASATARNIRIGQNLPCRLFTQRERQILALQQRGESNKDIAGILGIGVQTVKNHLHHIRVKTELCGQQVILETQVSELREHER
jgi:DNA-binding CsgD family transcriptional regulator